MDGIRIGRTLRTIRLRIGRRQLDVAAVAGVSRSLVSRVEIGAIDAIGLGTLEAVCHALGATLEVRVRWHGEHLDRLTDEAHAGIVEDSVRRLQQIGWLTAVEHSFNEFGERGSIDVLAWHPTASIALVVEVKTLIANAQETIHRHDRKARLGRKLAAELGWSAAHAARLLVVAATATNRRRIASLAATFDAAYPLRGDEARGWLRDPHGAAAALIFVPYANRSDLGTPPAGRIRVVVRGKSAEAAHVPSPVAAESKPGAKVNRGGA